MESRAQFYAERVAAWIAALIFLQTLYFKFTGHPDSVYIFTQIGGEPFLRLGLGVIELLIAIMLLLPRSAAWGALGGLGVMTGAIASHLLVLGISVRSDGGTLFALACVTALCCVLILYFRRAAFFDLFGRIKEK